MANKKSAQSTKPATRAKRVGRYVDPATSGRVTPKAKPSTAETIENAAWFGRATLGLGVLGVLLIVLNYLNVLPGATSAWYLLAGLACIFSAFFMATKLK